MTFRITAKNEGSQASGILLWDELPRELEEWNAGGLPATLALVQGEEATYTYVAKVKGLVGSGPVTNTAVGQVPGQAPVTGTAAVTVRGDYTVRIAVYNAAGELIKVLFVGVSSKGLRNFELNREKIEQWGERIELSVEGEVVAGWGGETANGGLVSNGEYYLKVDNIDSFGRVDVVVRGVTVNRPQEYVEVRIYNSAGEMVRQMGVTVAPGTMEREGRVELSRTVFEPSLGEEVEIRFGSEVWQWDGRNADGDLVQTGEYYVEVHQYLEDGREVIVTRPLAVMGGAQSLSVRMYPNPWDRKLADSVRVEVVGAKSDWREEGKVYTVSGELVGSFEGPGSGTDWVPQRASGGRLASGLYLVVLKVKGTNAPGGRKILKLLVAD